MKITKYMPSTSHFGEDTVAMATQWVEYFRLRGNLKCTVIKEDFKGHSGQAGNLLAETPNTWYAEAFGDSWQ